MPDYLSFTAAWFTGIGRRHRLARPALGNLHQRANARQPPPKKPTASTAANIVDICASVNSGALSEEYAQRKPALGKVKLADLALEFAAAFEW